MKFLIIASILCLATAELLNKAAPAVDESIAAFLEGSGESGSLARAIGSDEQWVTQAGEDIKQGLKEELKEALHKVLEKIKDSVDQGKEIGQELLNKTKELREKLKDFSAGLSDKTKNMIKDLRGKTKEILKGILEKLGLGKRNLDAEMDAVARSKFGDILQEVIEKITSDETIQKIRDYIKNIASDSELAQELKKLVEKLQDTDLKEAIKDLLQHKFRISQTQVARGETWDKIKNFFKDLKIKIDEHTQKFGEWVKEMWGKGLDKLREKHGAIKAIALEFIAHSKEISAEVAREALEFFRPYKKDLGTLWQQIVDAVKEGVGHF